MIYYLLGRDFPLFLPNRNKSNFSLEIYSISEDGTNCTLVTFS